MDQRTRPRRNRKSEAMRSLVRENILTSRYVDNLSYFYLSLCCFIFIIVIFSSDFIYPLFIHEENYDQEIPSMPACFRFSLAGMMKEIEEAVK